MSPKYGSWAAVLLQKPKWSKNIKQASKSDSIHDTVIHVGPILDFQSNAMSFQKNIFMVKNDICLGGSSKQTALFLKKNVP